MFSISRADLGLGRIMLLNLFSLLMVAVLSTQLKWSSVSFVSSLLVAQIKSNSDKCYTIAKRCKGSLGSDFCGSTRKGNLKWDELEPSLNLTASKSCWGSNWWLLKVYKNKYTFILKMKWNQKTKPCVSMKQIQNSFISTRMWGERRTHGKRWSIPGSWVTTWSVPGVQWSPGYVWGQDGRNQHRGIRTFTLTRTVHNHYLLEHGISFFHCLLFHILNCVLLISFCTV